MSQWKFVLISDVDPNCRVDLDTEFKADENTREAEEYGCCDVWSSDTAHGEALQRLGYTIAVVRKDLDNDES
jgi:hypothetical protein